MGWQDRDYARPPEPQRFGGGRPTLGDYAPRSISSLLIYVNVGIYILCAVTAGAGRPVPYSPVFQWAYMGREEVLAGQIWRLITSDYLHWNVTHLLMNMLGLYFLGRPLERVWGARKFFAVYTISGILGSLFYMLLTFYWFRDGVAAGASGCVLGLLGACAVMFPHAEVWVYFLFPVKIRTVAIVLGIMYVLNIWSRGNNAGGDACHLAGLVFGIWWATRGDRWWSLRSARRRSYRLTAPGDFNERMAQRRADVETIDRILDKVHNMGVSSLSNAEKRALAEATERQQQEEGRYGRTDRL